MAEEEAARLQTTERRVDATRGMEGMTEAATAEDATREATANTTTRRDAVASEQRDRA